MPELPEVEVVRRGADEWFRGRTISGMEILNLRAIRRHDAGSADFAAQLVGATLTSSRRRGKYFWFDLDTGDALVVHLGMSGQVRVHQPADVPHPHLRIRIRFTDLRNELWFLDQRTFGGMFVDHCEAEMVIPNSVRHIALDPFADGFDVADVARRIKRKNSPIKAVLLDQTVVSGIGNIYADESLWRSRLHWRRQASTVPIARIRELLRHSQAVMTEALAAGGTSFDSMYVNVNGSSGYFSRDLAAYGREGKPCLRCATAILREQFANRSSFRCPKCQRGAT